MPIYKVTVTLGEVVTERLIEGPSEKAVFAFAARPHFKLEHIKTGEQIKDMALLAATGVKVETAEAAE